MDHEQFPAVDEPLVRKLEELYPDRFPDKPMSEVELAEMRGAIKLIRFLRSEMVEQQHNQVLKR